MARGAEKMRRTAMGLAAASAALTVLRGAGGTNYIDAAQPPVQVECKSYDLQSGLLIKDDTKCVEAIVEAIPTTFSSGKLLRQIDYIVNGRTDRDRLYQLGLEYSYDRAGSSFKLAVEIYQGSELAAPSYRNSFNCKPYDRVDLKLTIAGDGMVTMRAEDLDNDTLPIETLTFKGGGVKFVGWKEGGLTGTSVFTEAYSTNLVVAIPEQRYALPQPANMTKVKFFIDETEWSSIFVRNASGDLSYLGDDQSYRTVAVLESPWIAALPERGSLVSEISTNGVSVLWSSGYDFKTCNSEVDPKLTAK
jgi:hypothetical protein